MMLGPFRRVCFLAACLFLLAGAARADEAAALRQRVVDLIAQAEAVAGPAAVDHYRYAEVSVERRGEGFRVTVEDFSMLLDPAALTWLQAGDLAFTMTPAGTLAGDALYRVTDLALPPRMAVRDASGRLSESWSLGQARFESLWSFAYLTHMTLDASLTDFRGRDAAPDGARWEIPSLALRLRSDPVGGALYDGAGALELRKAWKEADGLRFSAGRLELLFDSARVDFAAAAAANRKLAALSRETESREAFQGQTLLLGLSPEVLGGADLRLVADDLLVSYPGEGRSLALDGLTARLALDQARPDGARLDLAAGLAGMDLGRWMRTAGGAGDLLPRAATVRLRLDRLPLQDLLRLMSLEDTTGDAADLGAGLGVESDRLAGMPGMLMLLTMRQARTRLEILETSIGAPAASVELTGGLALDPLAAYLASGTLSGRLRGLDRIAELLQADMLDPDPETRETAATMLDYLATLKLYAERETGADGAAVDRFEVVLEPSGALSVNGQPLLPPARP